MAGMADAGMEPTARMEGLSSVEEAPGAAKEDGAEDTHPWS